MWDNFVILHGCKVAKLSCVDARWLCKSHLVCVRWQICLVWLWGDFAKVYKGKFMEIFIICALDIHKITSTQSHLTSMRDNFAILHGCKVAKLYCMDVRWLYKSDLAWPFSSCIYHMLCVKLSPPANKSDLTWAFSPRMAILILCSPHVPPPSKNNIFHLVWKNSQTRKSSCVNVRGTLPAV